MHDACQPAWVMCAVSIHAWPVSCRTRPYPVRRSTASPGSTRTPWRRSACFEILREDGVAGFEPVDTANRWDVEQDAAGHHAVDRRGDGTPSRPVVGVDVVGGAVVVHRAVPEDVRLSESTCVYAPPWKLKLSSSPEEPHRWSSWKPGIVTSSLPGISAPRANANVDRSIPPGPTASSHAHDTLMPWRTASRAALADFGRDEVQRPELVVVAPPPPVRERLVVAEHLVLASAGCPSSS